MELEEILFFTKSVRESDEINLLTFIRKNGILVTKEKFFIYKKKLRRGHENTADIDCG